MILISVLTPDALQSIPLFLDLSPASETPNAVPTPGPTPSPLFRIGDTISIRTGIITDNNGNPVPDGTPVQFSMMLTGEGSGILKQVDAVTVQGVAQAPFGLDKPGLLEIHATSDPAIISTILRLDVSQSGAVAVTVIVPQQTQSITETPVPTAIAPVEGYISNTGYPRFPAWLVAMLFIVICSSVGYAAGLRITERRSAFRWALGIVLGGLAAYNYLALGLFGIVNWLTANGLSGLIMFVFLGELLGFVAGWVWARRKYGNTN